jgi:hypothetical protein
MRLPLPLRERAGVRGKMTNRFFAPSTARCFRLAACLLTGAALAGDGPNLVRNGDFEQADQDDPGKPAHWDRVDGLGVQWADAPGHGKAIRFDTSISEQDMVARWQEVGLTNWVFPDPAKNAIAATYGLSHYSESIPVVTGMGYRVTFDVKTPRAGEGAKLWVRGYGQLRGERRRRYETIVFCRVTNNQWNTLSQVFHPTKLRPEVSELKVMLYAYWPPGLYWFDNIRLETISEDTYEHDRKAAAEDALRR